MNEARVAGKHGVGLALHHAVPAEAVAPVTVLAWDSGLGGGEFYPGRPLLPRLAQHRPQVTRGGGSLII